MAAKQRTLAAATAFSALPLGVEIYFEHFKGSFGDKWMWTPVALSPALTAAGFKVKSSGLNFFGLNNVSSQSPTPGTMTPRGSTVTIKF